MYPCAFVLLTGKKEQLYKQVISELKDAALNLKLVLQPKVIMTDFELAAINAFSYHFPNCQLRGCYFHFAQCLWKRFINLGFKQIYSENVEVETWFKSFVAMPLVPLNKVDELFVHLHDNIPSCIENDPKAEEFCDYVTETWLENESYPKSMWNQFDEDGPRTNNHVEGYNLAMHKFLSTHPNIWKFIEKISQEEDKVDLRHQRFEQGTLVERNRNRHDVERDLKIATNKILYLQNKVDFFVLCEFSLLGCARIRCLVNSIKLNKNFNNTFLILLVLLNVKL